MKNMVKLFALVLQRKKKPRHRPVPTYVPLYIGQVDPARARKQAVFWSLFLAAFFIIFIYFSSVLMPFVMGFILAYFLNPLVQKLRDLGVSRLWATLLITACILVVFAISLTILIPVIVAQLQEFLTQTLPLYMKGIEHSFTKHNLSWMRHYLGSDPKEVETNLQTFLSYGSDFFKTILNSLLNSSRSIVSVVSLLVIVAAVAFYLLLDWEKMVDAIDSWIPRGQLRLVRGLFGEMDKAVAGFVRGQGATSLILSLYYIFTLTFCGLNYALLLGLVIGLLSFIPYIGSMTGFFFAMSIAWVQFYPDEKIWILGILFVFLLGNFLEGYVLQPKLIGSSVGLHPIWLMFALFAFSSLFGLSGTIIAVPVAAALGVLVRFALHCYLASPVYQGEDSKKE